MVASNSPNSNCTSKDFSFNVIGGALWALIVPFAGYYLYKLIPNVDKYLLLIVILIIIVSAIPTFIEIIKERRKKIKGKIISKEPED